MTTGPNGFVAQLVTAVNNHDLEAIVGLFTADYVNETPAHPARGFIGNEQVTTTLFGLRDVTSGLPGTRSGQAVEELLARDR